MNALNLSQRLADFPDRQWPWELRVALTLSERESLGAPVDVFLHRADAVRWGLWQAKPEPTEIAEAKPEPTEIAEAKPEPPQADPAPSSAPKKQSRRKAVYQSAQTVRARAVLDRLFPDKKYPTKGEFPWPDLRNMFCEEYERYMKDTASKLYAKTNPTKKLLMPSERTLRRVLGWE